MLRVAAVSGSAGGEAVRDGSLAQHRAEEEEDGPPSQDAAPALCLSAGRQALLSARTSGSHRLTRAAASASLSPLFSDHIGDGLCGRRQGRPEADGLPDRCQIHGVSVSQQHRPHL